MEPKVDTIMIIIPSTMPNIPGIDHRIIEKTNPINITKRSLINTIIWWASACLLPSFARKINRHPAIDEKIKIKKPVKTGKVPIGYDVYAHHQKNPQAINIIPRSNSFLGFINGFNGSPVLDEIGNPNFLVFFKFYSPIIIFNIIFFNTFFLGYFIYFF